RQNITSNTGNVQTALNALAAGGGGDDPEAGLYALQQAATTTGWRAGSLRLIIWAGDAPSHDPAGPTNVTQAQAITALNANSVKVIAVGIADGAAPGLNQLGQATAVSNATGGSFLGDFDTSSPTFQSTVNTAIENAIKNAIATYSVVSLGVTPVPPGVTVTSNPSSITGSFDRSTTR